MVTNRFNRPEKVRKLIKKDDIIIQAAATTSDLRIWLINLIFM